MTCTQCGAYLNIGTKFCDRCGAAQPEMQHTQPPAQHQAATPSPYQQAPPPPGSPPPAPMNYYQPQQNTPPQYQQYQPNPNPYYAYPAQPPHLRSTGTPGGKLLRVISILYIVFAGLAVFSIFIGLVMSDFWDTNMPLGGGVSWLTYYSIFVPFTLYQLFMGIFGIRNHDRLEKAPALMVLGLIDIAAVLLSNILMLTIFSAMFNIPGLDLIGFNPTVLAWTTIIVGLISGLPLPILYTVGAIKNRKAFVS